MAGAWSEDDRKKYWKDIGYDPVKIEVDADDESEIVQMSHYISELRPNPDSKDFEFYHNICKPALHRNILVLLLVNLFIGFSLVLTFN